MFSLFLVQVIQAEIKVATLLTENNIPLAFAGKINKIFPIICPDSNIAIEYRMAKAKTTYVLNKSIAPCFLQETVGVMKNENKYRWVKWFRFRENESTHSAFVWLNTKKVETRFLSMCCTTGQSSGTAETIFSKTESAIDYLEVPCENCVGFSLDNTSPNMQIRNSIKSRIIAKNEACYITGCPCHIIHNTAHEGSTALTTAIHFEIEAFCVVIIYYFHKCTRRKCTLKAYYFFCDQ